MYKILLVGGIKGYTKYHNHIIDILQKINNEINISNIIFISLQPFSIYSEKADLYIGDKIDRYCIVNDKIMKEGYIDIGRYDIEEFDKLLNNSFDFVITEHAWFCNSVEILKYHNLLKMNGYLIRYVTECFPNSDLSYLDKFEYADHYVNSQHKIRNNIFLKNIETIFERTQPNIFKKVSEIYYDIENHSIKYEEHCVKYLSQISEIKT